MTKIIAWILSIMAILSLNACNRHNIAEADENTYLINGTQKTVADYTDIEAKVISYLNSKGYTSLLILDTEDMTTDILENRKDNGVLVVERVIGMVTNKEKDGDGIILNTSDKDHNHISYRSVDFETSNGTIILSYFIYNPNTNYFDDVIKRYDFVLGREYEDWCKVKNE